PPLTDVPIGAYMLVAGFDVISVLGHTNRWARDFYRAGTFALVGGAAISLLAVLTGFWDWWRSTEPGNQARRTVNAHAVTMLTVTALVLANVAVRILVYPGNHSTPALALGLSLGAAALTVIGGTIGGGLAFDYGFNVETAGDSPVWHESEVDVFPGQH
ncbi:MAG TPA: DUF2231 domain-containing protein, partial [Acidimicrobiia bacterium]|nr:DUF2231 domain-containing protein [Acidimicrobiia bacterium]